MRRLPSTKLKADRRKKFIRLMNRTVTRKPTWTRAESYLACSKNLVDGKPTLENPDSILNLGYCKPTKQVRRQLICIESMPNKNTLAEATTHEESEEPMEVPADCKDEEGEGCKDCDEKGVLIDSLVEEVETLKIQKYRLESRFGGS